MPPKEDGASSKSFTWITGNPRSKKNITQIRRHAGQNSGVKAENGARAHSSSSPIPGQRSSATGPHRPVYPSHRSDTTDEHSPATELDESIVFHVKYPPASAEDPAVPVATLEPVNDPQPSYLETPSSEKEPRVGEDAKAPRKLAIWDLVNHSIEEEERHKQEVLALTPGQHSEDDRQDYFGGSVARSELKQILSEARSHSPRRRMHISSPPPTTVVVQANIAKRRKATSGTTTNLSTWRLGMPHTPRSLSLSKVDSQLEQILIHTNAFYRGKFEASWSARLRENGPTYFDKISDAEHFAASVAVAGGLMVRGRTESASSTLERALPALSGLLISEHPQLYFLLADISLGANPDTILGRLLGELGRLVAASSFKTLGPSHPLTRTMCLDFPDMSATDRMRLRELVQRQIHELHKELFGPASYQTMGQYYFLSKVLSQLGRFEESRNILSELLHAWELAYGTNNIMTITVLFELSKTHLFLHDYSQVTEDLLSETLRRTLTLERSTSQEFGSSPDTRTNPMVAGLVNARIGCIRTLGRLHVMRGNLETAMMQYSCAVSIGLQELGSNVPAVQLALADLDAVSQMVRARALGDESLRYEWLAKAPVEVGLRWQKKEENPAAEQEHHKPREHGKDSVEVTDLVHQAVNASIRTDRRP